jgi:tetratricopeptide (TPR) repeat protein
MVQEKTSKPNFHAHLQPLLENGEYDKALAYLNRLGHENDFIRNAKGVCLMRLGEIDAALKVLRELVFAGQICIPSSTPPLYQANYATALLLKGYNQEALEILSSLDPKAHPYIAAMKETFAEWKKGLGLFGRILCGIRLYPRKPVALKYPPGAL